MKILFRKFPAGEVPSAAAGEVILRPARSEHRGRRDLATLVLDCGLDAFPNGGNAEHIVVDADPTLDDLLAATFLMRLLTGQELPEGCKAFARYAALVREGLNPSNLPLEISLEGIYLALRNVGKDDLTEPAAGDRFAADWSRMARCILQAAETGQDPFTVSLFATGPEFARERAFLAKDQEVYRQDVARGEQWLVAIPGSPPEGAAALLLRQPKSLLFKSWSRCDPKAPLGQAYLFLGVDWGKGNWIFSTDPVQRLEIKTLADLLQKEESAQDPERAQKDPWFDGKPFGHTLVAAPRVGTVLGEKKVLQVVKRWARARNPKPKSLWKKLALGSVAASLLIVGTILATLHFRAPLTDPLLARGFSEEESENPAPAEQGNLYLYAVGVSKYKNPAFNLGFADKDAEELVGAFRVHAADLFHKVRYSVRTNERAVREDILEDLAAMKHQVGPADLAIVAICGHGANLDEDDFFFCPYDFNDKKKAATGVYWSHFRKWLEKLPCRVIVVMDTCHSGTVTRGLRMDTPKSDKAMVVIAACLGKGKAQERAAWRHGALTLAMLEGITGKHIYQGKTKTHFPEGYGPGKVVSLEDLNEYVPKRVRELAGGDQKVVMNNTGNIGYADVHIATLR